MKIEEFLNNVKLEKDCRCIINLNSFFRIIFQYDNDKQEIIVFGLNKEELLRINRFNCSLKLIETIIKTIKDFYEKDFYK